MRVTSNFAIRGRRPSSLEDDHAGEATDREGTKKICVPARRRPHRLARSYTRRWIRSAVVNTAPGPRNRRSPLAFRKRGARALTFRRRRKAKARKVRVKVRHTLIPWGQHKRNARRRPRVAWAVSRILKHEPQNTVSQKALSRHARRAAARRTASERSAAARKAARTKGASGRSDAARKGSRTRTRRRS